jgi:transposase InsO family protein
MELVIHEVHMYDIRMGRIVQARLDEETLHLLTRLRRRTGLTDSELLRRGVRRLARDVGPPPRRRIVGVGKFASNVSDLATNKRYLKEFGRS